MLDRTLRILAGAEEASGVAALQLLSSKLAAIRVNGKPAPSEQVLINQLGQQEVTPY